eukprot:NODE_938_length_1223_cov_285.326235_g711_i0.p1 GENE.NODE_938_length_1223_cov_285.326235_g711_i0~~NODE_938_length_1223_cov_285.326235_g711_i0.p1  ORF type:complete len:342 (-),score=71.15 NODE_938_length_1223_cov_285.326235_g711_i0:135-1160(-)
MSGSEEVLPHIERVHALSEVRTPLICCLQNGNPLRSLKALAKRQGVSVWEVPLESPKNEQNALDYLEVGLSNGDWLYLVSIEQASSKVLRDVGLQLMTVQPDPKNFPKRELFRLWLALEKPVDMNDTCKLPAVLTQNALYGWKEGSGSKNKVQAKLKVDPELAQQQHRSKGARRDRGQDSDDESDDGMVEPLKKVTGLWFHRSTDLHTADAENQITQSVEDIFDAIEKADLPRVQDIVSRNIVDLNSVTRSGLTPLMWAIMCDNIALVRLLLENEADPNIRRSGDGMPPIFMHIEDVEMLQLLVLFGADIEARFEDRTLMDHPETLTSIRDFIKSTLLNES